MGRQVITSSLMMQIVNEDELAGGANEIDAKGLTICQVC